MDILANLIGSGLAILICAWYHRRMLERKRLARNTYQPVDGSDEVDLDNATAEVEFDQGQEMADLEAGGADANKAPK